MDDKQLDDLLTDAVHSYRPPPEAPLDAIWSRVEAEAFTVQPAKRAPGWRVFAGAIAATLVFGVLIGRVTASRPVAVPLAVKSAPTPRAPCIHRAGWSATSGRRRSFSATALLAGLPADPVRNERRTARGPGTAAARHHAPAPRFPGWPRAAHEGLLEDLELVLAQVARLQPQRPGESLTLINEALEERDVVPRIRSAVADLSGSEY